MSNLVTITSKFYDRSGRRVINLNVMSRYQGSKRENLQKTDLHVACVSILKKKTQRKKNYLETIEDCKTKRIR